MTYEPLIKDLFRGRYVLAFRTGDLVQAQERPKVAESPYDVTFFENEQTATEYRDRYRLYADLTLHRVEGLNLLREKFSVGYGG